MDQFIFMLFYIIFVLVIILIMREVYCWYSKINERIILMKSQIDQSRETNKLLVQLLQEARKESISPTDSSNYGEAATLELSSKE